MFDAMEKKASADCETFNSDFHFSMEIRINLLKEDKKVSRFKTMKLRHSNELFKLRFLLTVFPNGIDKESEDCLLVFPDVRIPQRRPRPLDYGILSFTVSVIDIEGESRSPQSFANIPSDQEDSFQKYLERSFVLSKEDEFISSNILTLRCDIHFYLKTVFHQVLLHRVLKDFLRPVPQEFCYRNKFKTGDVSNLDPRDVVTVFDFTSQILTLPQLHESRKRFGVFSSPASPYSPILASTELEDFLEHVWMFETDTARFLVSLDERQDSAGVRLLNSSPVIRRGVSLPMREHHQKRYPFPDTTSRTFIIVLYFLEKAMLPASDNRDFLDVYKFAHFNEMKDLLRKCSQAMVNNRVFSTEELEKTADLYSDEYLSELLELRCLDYEGSEQPRFNKEARPAEDCYI